MEYNLRKIRELRGLTQNELAKKSGISRVTISRIESGTQEDLMVGNLNRIAQALNCQVSELICTKNFEQEVQSAILADFEEGGERNADFCINCNNYYGVHRWGTFHG